MDIFIVVEGGRSLKMRSCGLLDEVSMGGGNTAKQDGRPAMSQEYLYESIGHVPYQNNGLC